MDRFALLPTRSVTGGLDLASAAPQPEINICLMSGFYMSLCCRGEVYLTSGQENPNCQVCGTATEWVALARKGGDPRGYRRLGEGNRRFYAAHASLNGRQYANVHILNYSARGMAIELSNPVTISAEARVYIEGFSSPLVGLIRHCTGEVQPTSSGWRCLAVGITRSWRCN